MIQKYIFKEIVFDFNCLKLSIKPYNHWIVEKFMIDCNNFSVKEILFNQKKLYILMTFPKMSKLFIYLKCNLSYENIKYFFFAICLQANSTSLILNSKIPYDKANEQFSSHKCKKNYTIYEMHIQYYIFEFTLEGCWVFQV